MKKYILIAFAVLCYSKSFSQCEVKTFTKDGISRFSMSELASKNEDLENGIKAFWLHANAVAKDDAPNIKVYGLLVTYTYSLYQKLFTPSLLLIKFQDGSQLSIKAKTKSTGTINNNENKIVSLSSVEALFDITNEDLNKIYASNIESMIITDIRENTQQNITPKYKGLLSEMFKCVSNTNN